MIEERHRAARPSTPSFLTLVIAVLGAEWLTAREIYEKAETQADPAKAALWAALRQARIESAHALTRRLKRYEGKGIERGSDKLGGIDLWGVSSSQ